MDGRGDGYNGYATSTDEGSSWRQGGMERCGPSKGGTTVLKLGGERHCSANEARKKIVDPRPFCITIREGSKKREGGKHGFKILSYLLNS